MGKIRDREILQVIQIYSATYVDDDGREYEICYQESFDTNIDYRDIILTFVEENGKEIMEKNDPELWKRIREAVAGEHR
ncbi:MAG: hypothetical protein ACXQTD_08245 [Candidatus Syntropharchaeia archaeon]